MKKHLLTLLIGASAMAKGYPAVAQNIVMTRDAYGHPVWTDRDRANSEPAPASTSHSAGLTTLSSRYSGLVYWSNKEYRWKPLPLNNSSTMKAARQAAREVGSMMAMSPGRRESRTRASLQPVQPGAVPERQMSPEEVDKAINAAAQTAWSRSQPGARGDESGIKLQPAGGFAQRGHGPYAGHRSFSNIE